MSEQEYPWRDESILREKYREENMTMEEIADELNISTRTVSKWINKFDIPTGGRGAGDPYKVAMNMHHEGYIRVDDRNLGESDQFMLHRLVAVAEYGFEKVLNKEVHHKNGIPWDNRPSNLDLLTASEHAKMHYEEQKENKTGIFANS